MTPRAKAKTRLILHYRSISALLPASRLALALAATALGTEPAAANLLVSCVDNRPDAVAVPAHVTFRGGPVALAAAECRAGGGWTRTRTATRKLRPDSNRVAIVEAMEHCAAAGRASASFGARAS